MDLEHLFSEAARLPLKLRRQLLRVACSVENFGRPPRMTAAGEELGRTLRIPRQEAAKYERKIAFINHLYDLEWKAILDRKVDGLIADSEHVAIPGRALVEHLATDRKPVILAPIHMGAFALPFARLVHDVFKGRPMLILRAREDRPHETKAMERISEIGTKMRFLNIRNKDDYFAAVRSVRDGGIIVSFVDLPGSYGGATSTTLFSRPVKVAVGVDSLARLTAATVVPLSVRSSSSGDEIDFGQPFEVYEKGPGEHRRVTNLIKKHLEKSILRAPEQWFMWARLDEYLVPTQPCGSAS